MQLYIVILSLATHALLLYHQENITTFILFIIDYETSFQALILRQLSG